MRQHVVGEGTGQPHTVWLTAGQGKPGIFHDSESVYSRCQLQEIKNDPHRLLILPILQPRGVTAVLSLMDPSQAPLTAPLDGL